MFLPTLYILYSKTEVLHEVWFLCSYLFFFFSLSFLMKRKLSNQVLNINQGQNTLVKVPADWILYVTPKHSGLGLKCLVITHLNLDKLRPIGSGGWIKCQVQQNAFCSLQRWGVHSFWSSLIVFEGNEMSFGEEICAKSPHACFLKVLLVHLVSLRSDEKTQG